MIKDRLISESCDFGVIYSLYLKQAGPAPRRVIVKVSWEENTACDDTETHSSVFELDLSRGTLWALGRKGNQLPADRFCAPKICAWAQRELKDYDAD